MRCNFEVNLVYELAETLFYMVGDGAPSTVWVTYLVHGEENLVCV